MDSKWIPKSSFRMISAGIRHPSHPFLFFISCLSLSKSGLRSISLFVLLIGPVRQRSASAFSIVPWGSSISYDPTSHPLDSIRERGLAFYAKFWDVTRKIISDNALQRRSAKKKVQHFRDSPRFRWDHEHRRHMTAGIAFRPVQPCLCYLPCKDQPSNKRFKGWWNLP